MGGGLQGFEKTTLTPKLEHAMPELLQVPPEREDRVLDQTRLRLKRIVAEAGKGLWGCVYNVSMCVCIYIYIYICI